MKRITWTTMEIQHLTEITEYNRKFDKRIDWDLVASQIPSRTASQCKSYYANVLKKNLDIPIRQNHQWNRTEILILWQLCVNFDKDFSFIQKNYIPNMTVKQIGSQFLQIQNKQQEIYQTFKQILNDHFHIQKLSVKDFDMQWWLIRFAVCRYKLIDAEIYHIPCDDVPQSRYRPDISEIKNLKMFFLDVNVNDLVPIYEEEATRRGMQNDPFVIPDDECSFKQLNWLQKQ
ncbi:Myb-like_DNA-binding domain-containing protein [Hexamita inflata]|uniref:Myb-like DNA-binding domain-containing protein n=1 Tax=Hexamita inflata TaxID=28002 RepID=A0AA86UME6_9EUKA|nr:Myb-like DNA-binding domain-containing protein [Hexamita inflata]